MTQGADSKKEINGLAGDLGKWQTAANRGLESGERCVIQITTLFTNWLEVKVIMLMSDLIKTSSCPTTKIDRRPFFPIALRSLGTLFLTLHIF